MKITGYTIQFLIIIIVSILIISCNKNNENEEFDAFADAFAIKKKINEEIKTATAYYVYANDAVVSATVIPPDESVGQVPLKATDERKYDYYYLPDSTEYNLSPPVSGNYVFEIESAKGEKIQKTDLLKFVNQTFPSIISTTFNQSTLALTVKWQQLTDTDGIFIKLADKEGNLVYISYALAKSVSEYGIATGDGNWISSVDFGDELILQVQSVIIEDDADENFSLYNIEATAVTETTVTWGE